ELPIIFLNICGSNVAGIIRITMIHAILMTDS
ncbi:unnamed protein product, partial [marine sediment metagenome]